MLLHWNPTPYVLGPEDGEAFWGLDNSLWSLKATAEQTGGRFSLIEEVAPRGEGTPLHVHREDDETFYVLEGSLRSTSTMIGLLRRPLARSFTSPEELCMLSK